MKKVFTNAELPHVWVHQTQANGRSSTMSFAGPLIWSYRAPIASIVGKKNRAVLFDNSSFSNTTAKHQNEIRRAIPFDLPVFSVPCIDEGKTIDHKRNLKFYRKKIEELVISAKRARKHTENYLRQSEIWTDTGNEYAEFFNLKTRFVPPSFSDVQEKIEAQAKTRKLEIKREKAFWKGKEEEERLIREEFLTAHLSAWRAGGNVYFPYSFKEAFLRMVGDEVQTSRGARVPVSHVKKVIPFIKEIQKGEKPAYKKNGKTIHLGMFSLNAIDSEGTVTAGCHVIPFSEVTYIDSVI